MELSNSRKNTLYKLIVFVPLHIHWDTLFTQRAFWPAFNIESEQGIFIQRVNVSYTAYWLVNMLTGSHTS